MSSASAARAAQRARQNDPKNRQKKKQQQTDDDIEEMLAHQNDDEYADGGKQDFPSQSVERFKAQTRQDNYDRVMKRHETIRRSELVAQEAQLYSLQGGMPDDKWTYLDAAAVEEPLHPDELMLRYPHYSPALFRDAVTNLKRRGQPVFISTLDRELALLDSQAQTKKIVAARRHVDQITQHQFLQQETRDLKEVGALPQDTAQVKKLQDDVYFETKTWIQEMRKNDPEELKRLVPTIDRVEQQLDQTLGIHITTTPPDSLLKAMNIPLPFDEVVEQLRARDDPDLVTVLQEKQRQSGLSQEHFLLLANLTTPHPDNLNTDDEFDVTLPQNARTLRELRKNLKLNKDRYQPTAPEHSQANKGMGEEDDPDLESDPDKQRENRHKRYQDAKRKDIEARSFEHRVHWFQDITNSRDVDRYGVPALFGPQQPHQRRLWRPDWSPETLEQQGKTIVDTLQHHIDNHERNNRTPTKEEVAQAYIETATPHKPEKIDLHDPRSFEKFYLPPQKVGDTLIHGNDLHDYVQPKLTGNREWTAKHAHLPQAERYMTRFQEAVFDKDDLADQIYRRTDASPERWQAERIFHDVETFQRQQEAATQAQQRLSNLATINASLDAHRQDQQEEITGTRPKSSHLVEEANRVLRFQHRNQAAPFLHPADVDAITQAIPAIEEWQMDESRSVHLNDHNALEIIANVLGSDHPLTSSVRSKQPEMTQPQHLPIHLSQELQNEFDTHSRTMASALLQNERPKQPLISSIYTRQQPDGRIATIQHLDSYDKEQPNILGPPDIAYLLDRMKSGDDLTYADHEPDDSASLQHIKRQLSVKINHPLEADKMLETLRQHHGKQRGDYLLREHLHQTSIAQALDDISDSFNNFGWDDDAYRRKQDYDKHLQQISEYLSEEEFDEYQRQNPYREQFTGPENEMVSKVLDYRLQPAAPAHTLSFDNHSDRLMNESGMLRKANSLNNKHLYVPAHLQTAAIESSNKSPAEKQQLREQQAKHLQHAQYLEQVKKDLLAQSLDQHVTLARQQRALDHVMTQPGASLQTLHHSLSHLDETVALHEQSPAFRLHFANNNRLASPHAYYEYNTNPNYANPNSHIYRQAELQPALFADESAWLSAVHQDAATFPNDLSVMQRLLPAAARQLETRSLPHRPTTAQSAQPQHLQQQQQPQHDPSTRHSHQVTLRDYQRTKLRMQSLASQLNLGPAAERANNLTERDKLARVAQREALRGVTPSLPVQSLFPSLQQYISQQQSQLDATRPIPRSFLPLHHYQQAVPLPPHVAAVFPSNDVRQLITSMQNRAYQTYRAAHDFHKQIRAQHNNMAQNRSLPSNHVAADPRQFLTNPAIAQYFRDNHLDVNAMTPEEARQSVEDAVWAQREQQLKQHLADIPRLVVNSLNDFVQRQQIDARIQSLRNQRSSPSLLSILGAGKIPSATPGSALFLPRNMRSGHLSRLKAVSEMYIQAARQELARLPTMLQRYAQLGMALGTVPSLSSRSRPSAGLFTRLLQPQRPVWGEMIGQGSIPVRQMYQTFRLEQVMSAAQQSLSALVNNNNTNNTNNNDDNNLEQEQRVSVVQPNRRTVVVNATDGADVVPEVSRVRRRNAGSNHSSNESNVSSAGELDDTALYNAFLSERLNVA